MTAWYRAGTVEATNGQTTVTGTLTAWLANAKVGDLFAPDADGRGYEITAVTSNTEIEIFPAYAGSSGSGKEYGIARISPNWNSVSELSVSLADILETQQSILSGEGVPDNSIGQDGDVYFRQDEAEYYRKSAGEWALVTSLTGPQGPAGPSYQATSTSSVAIGTGAKTFTVESGRGYSAGQWLRASNDASNYMEGTVTSYSGTTLVLNVPTGRAVGSGTYTSWNINIAGDIGPANSLTIGSVTTGAAGSSASAEITGSPPSQTLNLTIPRGNQGIQGIQGPQGPSGTLEIGDVTTVAPGDPATVTNSGTTSAAVLDFEIPQGEPGTPLNPSGDYNAGTTYELNDVVLELGSSWVYINETPGSGNAPPTLPTTSNTHWQLLAQAGSNGTGAVDLVNGQSGIVVLDGTDIDAGHSPANYNPAGDGIADHLAGIDEALGNVSSWGEAPDATVASAATTDIGAASGFYIEITGTTTITSFGTVANQWRFLRFAGILTLTHNATSLVLPGGANIATAAGDIAVFISDSDGNWRCASYQRASQVPIRVLDEDDMASDSATAVPSQQSVKAYVDATVASSTVHATDDHTVTLDELGSLISVDTSGASGNVTIGLPPVATAGDGAVLTVRLSEATHFVEIVPDGSETVDGGSAYTLVLEKQTVTLRCDGSEWNVIAESGTVEIGPDVGNGTYKKFADGTLICEFQGASQDVNTASGSLYRTSATSTWTFPHAFATGSIPSVAGSSNSNARWLSTGSPSNTSVTYRQYSAAQSSTGSASYLTAIGRWL